MGAAMSLDITGERIEAAVQPKRMYTPTILSVRAQSGTVEIHLNDEQLAEIEFAIRQHLDSVRYPEEPQETVEDVKLEYSIKEGIA
ncbi:MULTISPECIES: hypothetical protein [Paenibacillus]|uniref:Uncharacterized protein n=2 Tax=Paenibacillus TaxID=44249 RepID=A0A919XM61_9BACL|nr:MULTISPECIES: hypothetical protein [Paenibacillus]GIO33217.1 hypothetical protein J2TS6_43580 [Paenibacillus albilobatus]GIO48018.1 hypothetical protein J34TS1_27830 [Paenibacillus azoreducens]